MHILVIDTGSSSVKLGVFDMDTGSERFALTIERVTSIEDALASVAGELGKAGVAPIDAIGHRVAHGGARFRDSIIIDKAVIEGIRECTVLAPLHNPAALKGIEMAWAAWPALPQAAVFDTSFHRTLPECASTYAVPLAWREAGVRRYGFHGTSHHYIMERVAEALGKPASELRIISCHLGNGASVCAIHNGKSVDTSMGLTALEGLVMGTRCGDVDPGMAGYLGRVLRLSVEQIEDALYRKSGLLALSGQGSDMRDIEKRAKAGDQDAALAIEVFCYRLRKYIGAYAAAMEGVDVVAFTAGIGENSAYIREKICSGFNYLGLALDTKRNEAVRLSGFEAPQLQQPDSRVAVIVTQTREEWMIARETFTLLKGTASAAKA